MKFAVKHLYTVYKHLYTVYKNLNTVYKHSYTVYKHLYPVYKHLQTCVYRFTVEVGEELPELGDRAHVHQVFDSQIFGETLTYRDEARVYKRKTLECTAKTLMHKGSSI